MVKDMLAAKKYSITARYITSGMPVPPHAGSLASPVNPASLK